ncbi:MAG TPA: aquaporin [Anaerolineales bacterium]|nr:aquaporin [Anaerolineales bacterium]
MFNSKVFVAEFIGTFALVFIGASVAVVGVGGLLGVALAHGLVVTVFAYSYGHISGSQINPAVTFSLALNNTIKWAEAGVYWIAQFAGAIVAAYVLKIIVGSANLGDIQAATTAGTLTEPAPFVAMGVEIILTFFLVNTILHTVVAGKGGVFAGLTIGLTLVFAILAGGPMTGASLNPARTFGPALVTGNFTDPMTYLIYFAGPLLGAALAVGVFKFLNRNEIEMPPVIVS